MNAYNPETAVYLVPSRAMTPPAQSAAGMRGVKVTIAPTPPDRYAPGPGAIAFGCGFSAVQVGFDVETGRPWA